MHTPEQKQAALAVIRSVLTEENSDKLKRILKRGIKKKLPGWLRWLPIGKILDSLLPEVLIDFFEHLLS